MGGEKQAGTARWSRLPGSPPRGRGKVFGLVSHIPCFGITPAWAGKSLAKHSASYGSEDHPRVGGEKCFKSHLFQRFQGSPPRGRGKASSAGCQSGRLRITPAWAGKSNEQIPLANVMRDHPRVGGEKRPELSRLDVPLGSPPRGRGKVCLSLFQPPNARITPAWAGKSSQAAEAAEEDRDHPRVGGEKQTRS